jgi:alpha-glucosidase (family GH31 glycosyl hydrolase)
MRPLFFEFPTTTDLTGEHSEFLFMFGHALLVKPATFIDDEKE